ncbi:ATP-binding protein [Clostridium sp. CX1]|uniref:MASE3 domain-containing protein n=1 Tax=Clostridium sp. CX1 TaxID=2978346 RepID=UPI0021BE12BC|nr:MASE3 domain-containing protein [Clostridium sp. CX1]MCT8975345.1 ATP-binding protein [Clostridium sp. CX1]
MSITNDNVSEANLIKNLLLKALMLMIFAFVIAFLIHNTWVKYLSIYHTVLELTCVFIALSIFFSIWYNFQRNKLSDCIIGFGFLVVAVFDGFHTFYHFKLNLLSDGYYDLSTIHWILGRFTEASVIFLSAKNFKNKLSKWIYLSISMVIAFGTSYFIVEYHEYLPILLTESGVTKTKVFLEYIIICLYSFGIYRFKDKIKSNGRLTYSYVLIALFMMISSEICFTLYSSITSFIWTAGHLLKIISYYCLFKGIFVSTVVYPYERLEVKHKELEKAYYQLEEANKEINGIRDTLSDILDSLPEGVFLYDSNRKIKYLNRKFEELFHCDRSTLNKLTTEEVSKLFPGLEQNKKLLPDNVCLDCGKTLHIIRTFKVGNGQYKKLSIHSNKIRGGVLGLVRDAKEEQELKNLHLQTETILNAVNNGVLMIDTNKKIILTNKAIEDILEMDKEDIIGMDINELNELVQFDAKQRSGLSLEDSYFKEVYETCIVTKNGNKKELEIQVSSIRNVEGEIIGGISVCKDITSIKKEQLKIQQQEKLALLGQLGAGIVHETRNYLTTIKGRCQLIELVAKEKEIKDYAKKIDIDVSEVNRIISEFLFLSKPRETELQEVSMYDIFQSIKNIVQSSSLVKGVDVQMNLSKEERYLLCDEVQVKQVILNICKNAVDAMGDKLNPQLIIETGYDELNNEMFIKITDNGKGISEEDLSKIGTLFFTTKKTGTGLGLNVCFQIINQHKGRIEVESKLGEGTSFTIILPCIDDDEIEEQCIV